MSRGDKGQLLDLGRVGRALGQCARLNRESRSTGSFDFVDIPSRGFKGDFIGAAVVTRDTLDDSNAIDACQLIENFDRCRVQRDVVGCKLPDAATGKGSVTAATDGKLGIGVNLKSGRRDYLGKVGTVGIGVPAHVVDRDALPVRQTRRTGCGDDNGGVGGIGGAGDG